MMHTYTAYGKTWVVDERDRVILHPRKGSPVELGHNHHRAWKAALLAPRK